MKLQNSILATRPYRASSQNIPPHSTYEIIITQQNPDVPDVEISPSRARTLYVQDVPGVKVTTSGVTSLADAESKTSYTHGSNSQRFRSYEVWKKLERKEEHFAFIDYYFLLLLISYRFVVQHELNVRSVIHLLKILYSVRFAMVAESGAAEV
jgi:hypothetical protein